MSSGGGCGTALQVAAELVAEVADGPAGERRRPGAGATREAVELGAQGLEGARPDRAPVDRDDAVAAGRAPGRARAPAASGGRRRRTRRCAAAPRGGRRRPRAAARAGPRRGSRARGDPAAPRGGAAAVGRRGTPHHAPRPGWGTTLRFHARAVPMDRASGHATEGDRCGDARSGSGSCSALSASAAAMAAAVAVTPWVVGADRNVTDISAFGTLEGGDGLDHAAAHTESAAEQRRYLRQVARCRDDAYSALATRPSARTRAGVVGPAPGRRAGAASFAARPAVAALDDRRAIDGEWGPLFDVPSTAIHAVLLPTGKVLWFSSRRPIPVTGRPVDGTGGNAHLFDPVTGRRRASRRPDRRVRGRHRQPPPTSGAAARCSSPTARAGGRGQPRLPRLPGPGRRRLGLPRRAVGGHVRPVDRDLDAPRRHGPRALVPEPHRAARRPRPDPGGWDETGGDRGRRRPGLPGADDQQHGRRGRSTPRTDVDDGRGPVAAPRRGRPAPLPRPPLARPLPPPVRAARHAGGCGAGGDKVLVAGPLRWDSAILDTSDWSWSDIGPLSSPDRSGGRPCSSRGVPAARSAWCWSAARTPPQRAGRPRHQRAAPDERRGARPDPMRAPRWTPAPDLTLRTGRSHFNTVLLPDGSLFSAGAATASKQRQPLRRPGLSRRAPGAGSSRVADRGGAGDARTYHSTAVLLPDGRVLSAGDDRDAHIPLAEPHRPDLLAAPTCSAARGRRSPSAPDAVGYGAAFRVGVAGAPAAIARAVLVHPGAVTHSVNMAQRSIELDVTADSRRPHRCAQPAGPDPRAPRLLHAARDRRRRRAVAGRLGAARPRRPRAPRAPGRPGPPSWPPCRPRPPRRPGRPAPLRLASLLPRAVRRGRGAVVVVRLRASRDVSALVTLAGPRGGPTATRRVALRAGHALSRAIAVPPALRGSPTVRLRAVVRTARRRPPHAHRDRAPAARRLVVVAGAAAAPALAAVAPVVAAP